MKYIKYNRTYHLPYSETITEDDKRLKTDIHFIEMDSVVCTIKMDGENSSIYPDGYIHARSLDGNKHPWQTWLKKYIQNWCYEIPTGWRVCGENLYAEHSISYIFKNESQFFQVFGIYDDKNNCISWKDTLDFCELLNINHVPVFYVGKYDKDKIMKQFQLYKNEHKNQEVEGFVVRNIEAFSYNDFSKNVGKYVRKNHVTTDVHWIENWKPNKIEE